MAEFVEVLRQAKRMCKANCEECPLSHTVGNICPIAVTGNDEIAEIEHIVMDWAKAHPEPRYPSWQDAWNKLFPEAVGGVPCPKHFISEKQYDEMCIGNECECCLESPIPADTAEKLGIKPIGGE